MKDPEADPARGGFDPRLPLLGAFVLAVFSACYVWAPGVATTILRYSMLNPETAPFADLNAIVAAIRCAARGVDVYRITQCDGVPIVFNYPPLWLHLTFLPTNPQASPYLGLGLDTLFFLSLGLLPRTPNSFAPMALAMFGSLPVFACERGNLDLLIFIFAVAAAALATGGGPRRAGAYGLIALAAALKYYPIVALVVAARERLRTAVALAAAVAVGGAAFLWAFHGELNQVVLPHPDPFTDAFGARQLPKGLEWLTREGLRAGGFSAASARLGSSAVFIAATLALLGAAAWGGSRLVGREPLTQTVRELPARSQTALVVGSAILCGSFVAIDNVGYRGVFLLMVLPSLIGLAQSSPTRAMRRVFGFTSAAVVYLLWMLAVQKLVGQIFGGEIFPIRGSAVAYAVWAFRELLWWEVFATLASVLVAFVSQSAAYADWRALAGGSRGSAAHEAG